MSLSWWLGIGVGIGVMGGHAALRAVTHRLALRRSTQRAFLLVELGGLGGRMVLLFGAVAFILLYIPVHQGAFVGTVLLLLVASMVFEVYLIFRHLDRNALGR